MFKYEKQSYTGVIQVTQAKLYFANTMPNFFLLLPVALFFEELVKSIFRSILFMKLVVR